MPSLAGVRAARCRSIGWLALPTILIGPENAVPADVNASLTSPAVAPVGSETTAGAVTPAGPHLRVRFTFRDGGPELRFVDQRTFGGLAISPGGAELPAEIAHIARDPFDPAFDPEAFVAGLRVRRTGVKRALLDQTFISGVGNIYADESLWRAHLHGERPSAP